MPDFRNLTDRLTERGSIAERECRFGDASDMQDARAEIERLRINAEAWKQTAKCFKAEADGLRAALKEIADNAYDMESAAFARGVLRDLDEQEARDDFSPENDPFPDANEQKG